MAKSKEEIIGNIDKLTRSLTQQLEDVKGQRGSREETVRMVAPAFLDQLKVMRDVVERT